MRGKTLGWGWVLAAVVALLPAGAQAQTSYEATGYAPPDSLWHTGLISSTRPEDGGFFLAGSYVMYRQTNPMKEQLVAVRGFTSVDGSVVVLGVTPPAGSFIGSGVEALNTQQLSGPNGYQPGFKFEGGYRFGDGGTLTLGMLYLSTAETRAVATLAPHNLQVGPALADSFVSSPVFNFPNDFAGPDFKVNSGNAGATFGIWNAASVMSISLLQRFTQYEATWREPLYENPNYRFSSLVGPRITWIWERFKWRTVDLNVAGAALDPTFVGVYTNITSNRMYGVHCGCSQECYIGHGFAVQLDTQGSLFMDSVKERAKYQLGDHEILSENKRSLRKFTIAPELEAELSLAWYPRENMQIRIGYDVMMFFNTLSSPRPISFDYSGLNPTWESQFRLFDGFHAGLSISF
jgi:hypothetical protein